MKILVLLPGSPGPMSNAAARYFGPVLKQLNALGHSVTVFALCRDGAGEPAGYFADTRVRFKFFDPPGPRPFHERKLRSLWRSGWELCESEFGSAARREADGNYDVILAEMPETARILEDDPRTVLSLHHFRFVDLLPMGEHESFSGKLERFQARRAELSTCRRVRTMRATSQRLRRQTIREGVKKEVRVIPICLDPGLYQPVEPPSVPTVGVLGSMFWPPSRRSALHFLEKIAPKLRLTCPRVRFVVGGWNAQKYLASQIRHDDVELLDSFKDPRDAFARLSVLVYAPPVGTGMKVKVLEAMAYGVPAVVNDEGFEGLEYDTRPPIRLARSDEEIIENVTELLKSVPARRAAAAEGHECIRRSFSPAVVTHSLNQFLELASQ